jgi:hypothetical protein
VRYNVEYTTKLQISAKDFSFGVETGGCRQLTTQGHYYRKLKIRISEYPIIRYSDFCEIVYSSRTLLSEAHIGAADNRVYIRARTNIDEYRCTCIFGCVFSLSVLEWLRFSLFDLFGFRIFDFPFLLKKWLRNSVSDFRSDCSRFFCTFLILNRTEELDAQCLIIRCHLPFLVLDGLPDYYHNLISSPIAIHGRLC